MDCHYDEYLKNPPQFGENYYREIFDCLSDAIFVLDASSGEIIDVNSPMLRMYGYEKDEVLGTTIAKYSSCNSPYRQEDALGLMNKAKDEGPQIFEWEAKRENGTLFWVEVNLRYSELENGSRLIAVIREITERKKVRDLLVQNEKLLSVSGLAAGMAHEINNPLAGMMQTANVMAKRLGRKSLDSQDSVIAAIESGTNIDSIKKYMKARDIPQMIDNINDSGIRVASVVNNILSYSFKIDSSSSHYDLKELLDKTLELLRFDAELKKEYDLSSLQVKKRYCPENIHILCDGAKIQQTLLNIFTNSVQVFNPANIGKLLISIDLRVNVKQNMAEIIISDNGPGIDEEVRTRIFEPFFTTKTVGEGMGLGLSKAHFVITENHGGHITLLNNKDGASFLIQLPVN